MKTVLSKNPFAFVFVPIVILTIMILPLLIHVDPMQVQLQHILRSPGLEFFLGTDSNGRDILLQIVFGAKTSLLISLQVVFNCLLLGMIMGFTAGYNGGWVDRLFLMVADLFQAFPGILLAIAIAAFLTPSVTNLIILLSFVGWVSYARVIRAQTIEMKSREFVMAGKALGLSWPRLLFRHFLPNMAGPLIVQASFGMAGVILAESTLSFLGLGLPESVPSLGKLMDNGVSLLMVAPHVALFPGLVIMCFVLLFNHLGDRLRDQLT